MAKKSDNKIRIRCPGCGKRVKFPAGQPPGTTFRCPICKTTIVTPLNPTEVASFETEQSQAAQPLKITRRKLARPIPQSRSGPEQPVEPKPTAEPTQATPAPRAPTPSPKPASAPSEAEQMNDTIEKVTVFLNKENDRVAQLSRKIVTMPGLSRERLVEEFQELRHEKAVHLKRYLLAILRDLDRSISKLRDDPASETSTGKDRLARLVRERECFVLYIKVMFELRKGTGAAGPTGAKPGTPSAAKAPPSKPSQRAAQSPPDKGDARPGPGDKAPDSSGARPC